MLGAAAAVALSSASLQKEEEGGKEEKQGSRPKKGKGGMAATGATPPQQSAPRAPLKLLPHIQRKPTTWVYQRKGQHPNVLWRTISWAELRCVRVMTVMKLL